MKLTLRKYMGPINVCPGVWFYTSKTGRTLEFVVESSSGPIQFKVPISKIEKLGEKE